MNYIEQYYEYVNNIGIEIGHLDRYLEFVNDNNLIYLGHGGSALVFTDSENKYVYKICKKNKKILASPNSLNEFALYLKNKGIKILEPENFYCDGDIFFIYKQKYCNSVSKITDYVLVSILDIIIFMFKNNCVLPDLYFRNFGFYNNEIYVYDYHDGLIKSPEDKIFVAHLAHLFSIYYYGKIYADTYITQDDLYNSDFGYNYFDNKQIPRILELFYYNINNQACKQLEILIESIRDKMIFSINCYQQLEINRYNKLILKNHTKEKFDFITKNITNFDNINTVCDFGCCIGGIGLKIAEKNPRIKVTLNNITISELDICENIKNRLELYNAEINKENIINMTAVNYDLTLYYAILHHLLKNLIFNDMMNLIHTQTKLFSIVEIPIGGDVLLNQVVGTSKNDYINSHYYLESIELFSSAIKPFFEVIDVQKINYGTDDLNRYAFFLRKRN